MRILSYLLLFTTCFSFSPLCTRSYSRGVWSFERKNSMLHAIEEDSDSCISRDTILKMEELERALSSFLDDANDQKLSPKPPIAPPLAALGLKDSHEGEKLSLKEAEKALQNLRKRLKLEEESLRKAEQLEKSLEEEDAVLKRAELVLKKSLAAAEQRKMAAKRRTDAALQSEREAKESAQKIEQDIRAMRSTVSIASLTSGREKNERRPELVNTQANGLPVLINWSQDLNGSITGIVKGSEIFADGDTVSTSSVPFGAKGGSIIITTSGSRYYLEEKNESIPPTSNDGTVPNQLGTAKQADNLTPELALAPVGVPSIRNWEPLEDGGVSGLLFGSTIATDGDYIETSPIATGNLENGSIVTTRSGSLYFLSSESGKKIADTISTGKDLEPTRRSGTITITKAIKNNDKKPKKIPRTAQKKILRSTFSLANLGSIFNKTSKQSDFKDPGQGIPTLTCWDINKDGTITGIITGSTNIQDGDLVTTSPVIQGQRKRFKTVTTISGSEYYLD